MRILNCFHTIADLDQLSEEEWSSGSETGYIDTCYLKQILNYYDESALELSCRLKDACDSLEISCKCTAVTVADWKAKPFLERMAALGFIGTDLILLSENALMEQLTSERTAGLLAAYIKQQPEFDFILTGLQSGDGFQGKVPFLLAEYLGIRCITNVVGIQPVSESTLFISSQRETAVYEETISSPAVLVVGNVAGAYLRVPTLRQRMQSRQQKIILYPEKDLDVSLPREYVRLLHMHPILQKRDAVVLEGADSEKAAEVLLEYYTKWT